MRNDEEKYKHTYVQRNSLYCGKLKMEVMKDEQLQKTHTRYREDVTNMVRTRGKNGRVKRPRRTSE